jgi:hypothetical protein
MEDYGIGEKTLNWVHDFLTDRKQKKHFYINTCNCNNSKLCNILLYILLKTEQNATGLIKYKLKTCVDYL